MDDPFITAFYAEYTNDLENMQRFYIEEPEIRFVIEKTGESVKINLNNFSVEVLPFLNLKTLKKINLYIGEKFNIKDYTCFHLIGIFVYSDYIYQRFSHQIFCNEKGKIIGETLVMLDEKIKFDSKTYLTIENYKNPQTIQQLIKTFENYGEIVYIENIEQNRTVKLYFNTETAKKNAQKACKEGLIQVSLK